MTHVKTHRRIVTALACLGFVAACGGDDDTTNVGATSPAGAEEPAGTGSPSATGDPAGTGPTASAGSGAIDPTSIEHDVGIDDEHINVGMLAALSGAYAAVGQEATEGQRVYWDQVNRAGGVAGRQIRLVVEDSQYDVQTTVQKYDAIHDDVAILSQVSGSPHTAAIADSLAADDLIAIPYTWYSGWADPEIGPNVLESYSNYCLESMNGIEWLHDNRDVQKVAIISFPGEYGEDAASGARYAAEELGLEVVYDGTGQVTTPSAENPSPDQSAVTSQIVDANPDAVWVAGNPASLTSIVQAAANSGYDGWWSGNWPTYNAQLLGTSVADVLDRRYIASSFLATWGADVPGMQQVVDAMTEARPNLKVADAYVLGWTQAKTAHAVLEQAAKNGDMTRAGIVEAAGQVTVDFNGLAPTQSWSGDPDENLVRETYLYDLHADRYNNASLRSGQGDTGYELLAGPYTGSVAQGYRWDGPCFAG